MKKHATFDPVDARGVAHDLLEHRGGDKGTVMEEMQALGAFAFTRLESGLMRESYRGTRTDAQVIASDIVQVFRDKHFAGATHELCTERAATTRKLDYEEWDEVFAEAVTIAASEWASELEGCGSEEDVQQREVYFSGEGAKAIISSLRRGFRWAQRRYRHSTWVAAQLFRTIEQRVSAASRGAELGDELVVRYELNTGDVRTTLRDAYGYEK